MNKKNFFVVCLIFTSTYFYGQPISVVNDPGNTAVNSISNSIGEISKYVNQETFNVLDRSLETTTAFTKKFDDFKKAYEKVAPYIKRSREYVRYGRASVDMGRELKRYNDILTSPKFSKYKNAEGNYNSGMTYLRAYNRLGKYLQDYVFNKDTNPISVMTKMFSNDADKLNYLDKEVADLEKMRKELEALRAKLEKAMDDWVRGLLAKSRMAEAHAWIKEDILKPLSNPNSFRINGNGDIGDDDEETKKFYRSVITNKGSGMKFAFSLFGMSNANTMLVLFTGAFAVITIIAIIRFYSVNMKEPNPNVSLWNAIIDIVKNAFVVLFLLFLMTTILL